MRTHPIREPKSDKGIIVHLRTRSSFLQLCIDTHRLPKEVQRLVNQVTAKIIQQSPSFLHSRKLAPDIRTRQCMIALVTRFKACERSEQVRSNQLADGEEIIIPAPILKDAEEFACSLACCN